jgi:hypothetical protein
MMNLLLVLTTDQKIAMWAIIVPASLTILGIIGVAWKYFASQKVKTSGDDKNVDSTRGELDQLRKEAKNTPLSILVWGPEDDGSEEYVARCNVRDELNKIGHDAIFSEELCRQENALDDPIQDEILQARSFDAIVIIYGSRGTQTELDRIIVPFKKIARKTTIIVKESMLSSINSSLSSKSWQELNRDAEIINYSKLPLGEDILERIRKRIQKLSIGKFLTSDIKEIPEDIKRELEKTIAASTIAYEVPIRDVKSSVLSVGDPTSDLKYRIIEVYK